MSRPLRLEFPGALYHVTARGNRKNRIYHDDVDRRVWLRILRQVCMRFNFSVHAYCQMTNHYHLMVETIDGGLARGMRHLNGVYSQYVNRRHELVGHMFQGRYHAVVVQKERHLLELSRYVVLNPVRAGIVARPEDWQWSSYRYMAGAAPSPRWLDKTWTLEQFGSARTSPVEAYCTFVDEGLGAASPLKLTRHQLILGDEMFLGPHSKLHDPACVAEVPRIQRRSRALSLSEYERLHPSRDEAMGDAYRSTAFSMGDIARHFGVSVKTVSRAVARLVDVEVALRRAAEN
ncbi:addiction module toxin RelE [Massilia sp. RP-1-19]|uniref:Addiction module toxin RelE n=1 Tax=Massilia polaris TaxID=2728846 RepID=A0A848HHU3_9BURK|nr:transposase [Massilia polaris]NML60627.1 addiction module toxin RelE [Massilia polaris]